MTRTINMSGPRVFRDVHPAEYVQGCLFDGLPGFETSPSPRAEPDAVVRLLRAASEAYASWFRVVRDCVLRDRVRQQHYRDDQNLPREARIPYQRQPLTASDLAVSAMSETLIRGLFGDAVAEYARAKFDRAISTGDMRAFKIRILMIKARDSITPGPLHDEFAAVLNEYISRSEEIAGCQPDPSPRRMSRAERYRKNAREARLKELRRMCPELNLVWTDEDGNVVQYLETAENGFSGNGGKPSVSGGEQSDSAKAESVTVTRTVTLKEKKARSNKAGNVVRKARSYSSVDEIMADIEAGLIVPYESVREICRDVKSGRITAIEAFMFTLALDRYLPEVSRTRKPEKVAVSEEEIEDEIDGDEDESEDVEDENEDGDDPDEEDEEDQDDEDGETGRNRSSFSYNPRGFSGVGGHYSGGGMDWNADDE